MSKEERLDYLRSIEDAGMHPIELIVFLRWPRVPEGGGLDVKDPADGCVGPTKAVVPCWALSRTQG